MVTNKKNQTENNHFLKPKTPPTIAHLWAPPNNNKIHKFIIIYFCTFSHSPPTGLIDPAGKPKIFSCSFINLFCFFIK